MLEVNLDEFDEAILVQVQYKVMDEVEAVEDDDEGELVLQLCLLQKALDLFGVVGVAFTRI